MTARDAVGRISAPPSAFCWCLGVVTIRRHLLSLIGLGAGLAAANFPVVAFSAVGDAPADSSRLRPLLWGLGTTGAAMLAELCGRYGAGPDEADCWMGWSPLPLGMEQVELGVWCGDAEPFSERNVTHLYVLARLGEEATDLVSPIADHWRRYGVPVSVLMLRPDETANLADWDRAISQVPGIDQVSERHLLDSDRNAALLQVANIIL